MKISRAFQGTPVPPENADQQIKIRWIDRQGDRQTNIHICQPAYANKILFQDQTDVGLSLFMELNLRG